MAKALRVFIILILLLSGVSLWLGIELFLQRDVLKQRVQTNENTLDQISKDLHATNFVKNALMANKAENLPAMKAEQGKLHAVAQTRWNDLVQNGNDYTNTLIRLDETNKVLAATQQDLADRKAEIVKLNDTISQKDQQLAQKDSEIGDLKTAKADLEQKVKDRDDKIAKNEETIRDLKDEIKSDEEDIRRDEAEITARDHGIPYIPAGTAGRVVAVNDDWSFVVLNIGSNQKMVPNGYMYVHRGDKLLGRLKLTVVYKNMSIAAVEPDWQEGRIKEGDFVVH
jgi:hypothetical protein